MSPYFAHSLEGQPESNWQPLEDHLNNVALLSKEFADKFGCGEWGNLAGLWHDLGKYSSEFQSYLRNQEDLSQSKHIDHSSAGTQHAVDSLNIPGHLLAYAVAGHHSGLLDGRSEYACQKKRLLKSSLPWKHGLSKLPDQALPDLPLFIKKALVNKDGFILAFFIRMLFSCLVDADFLDTERFMDPGKFKKRNKYPSIKEIANQFHDSLNKLETNAPDTPINKIRHSIRLECENAANLSPGFFSLTVPTGGGKTLSSLAFAIRHALKYQFDRIIYIIPFISIIEQNADVFRKHLGNNAVLEHHCNTAPKKETMLSRLASENWNAPLVVSTSIQFYDSLFSNKSSRCRKLHRLANSIIILDEAQTIPVDYLKPCLRALEQLAKNYRSTIVICTATQPAINKRDNFPIGLNGIREISQKPKKLYSSLKRVEIKRAGNLPDDELRKRILKKNQLLCIVNTTKHARLLFEILGPEKGHFHLSARMCPAHRRLRLWQIRRALEQRRTCRVISTQVVEAGVDLDFPVVYRALAGLDSIAQAAGRCNRNGVLSEMGKTYVFTTEHKASEQYFSDTANISAQIMELYSDPLDLKANEHFFKLYYWDQISRWDANHILDNFTLIQDRDFPFNFSFSKTAKDFHLIDDSSYCSVVIPWGRKGRELCERLRHLPAPDRETLRWAQNYMVRIYSRTWNDHAGNNIYLIYDNLGILESPETHYDNQTGLNLEAEGPGTYFA